MARIPAWLSTKLNAIFWFRKCSIQGVPKDQKIYILKTFDRVNIGRRLGRDLTMTRPLTFTLLCIDSLNGAFFESEIQIGVRICVYLLLVKMEEFDCEPTIQITHERGV